MELFYYGCEFVYTAAIVWGTLQLLDSIGQVKTTDFVEKILKILALVLVSALKVYNISFETGLFSNAFLLLAVFILSFFGKVIYTNKLQDNILIGCLFWSVLSVIDFLVLTLLHITFVENGMTNYFLVVGRVRGIYLLVWSVAIICLGNVISNWMKYHKAGISKYKKTAWLFMVVLVLCLIYFQRIYKLNISTEYVRRWWIFILGAVLFGVLFFVHLIWQEEKSNLRLQQMKVEMLEKNYLESMRIEQEKAVLLHDMKNHMKMMQQLIAQGRMEDAKTYLIHINGVLEQKQRHAMTNHFLIDLILDLKIQEAKEKGVQVFVESGNMDGVVLNHMEICALFTNLLDNAIDANEDLPCDREKWIQLFCKRQNKLLTVSVINPTDRVIDEGGGLPKSTKKDKSFHGIGIRSIKQVVDSYDGHMRYYTRDGEFHISICLNGFA